MNRESWRLVIVTFLVGFVLSFAVIFALELGVIAYEQVEYIAISRHIAAQNDNPPVIEGPPLTPQVGPGSDGQPNI